MEENLFDLFPEIKADIIQNIVEFKYRTKTVITQLEFDYKYDPIFIKQCLKCKKEINIFKYFKYCIECKGFLCKNEKDEIHSKKGSHKTIKKSNYCFAHNQYNRYICLDCKKDLCNYCKKLHKTHQRIKAGEFKRKNINFSGKKKEIKNKYLKILKSLGRSIIPLSIMKEYNEFEEIYIKSGIFLGYMTSKPYLNLQNNYCGIVNYSSFIKNELDKFLPENILKSDKFQNLDKFIKKKKIGGNNWKIYNKYSLKHDYNDIIYFRTKDKIFITSNFRDCPDDNRNKNLIFDVADKNNGYHKFINLPCSSASYLKLDILNSELKNKHELFFLSYYYKNKIEIIKFIYFSKEKFEIESFQEINVEVKEEVLSDSISFIERKNSELLFCFSANKNTWVYFYNFDKKLKEFKLIKSFIVDFNIDRILCFNNNDIIVLINKKDLGIIKSNENEDVLKAGKFFRKKIDSLIKPYFYNGNNVNFYKFKDRKDVAIMIITRNCQIVFYNCYRKEMIFKYKFKRNMFDKSYLFKKDILIFVPNPDDINQVTLFIRISKNYKLILENIIKFGPNINVKIYEDKNKRILLDYNKILELGYEN